MNTNIYYAKILLFGEYSVIFNSMGLTIPYTHFTGQLSMPSMRKYTDIDFAQKSNQDLREYYKYLHSLKESKTLKFDLDFNSFLKDIDDGLYFESSIPQGFGLGSSGALVSAIYANYGNNPIGKSRQMPVKDILKLKDIFSQMESFFHGTSSGLDPLNCYIQFPLLIKKKDDIRIVNIPKNQNEDSAIFLINTGSPGKTQPLVNLFLSNTQDKAYKEKVINEFIPFTNASIESLVEGNYETFFDNLARLSKFEFEYLKPMIPEKYRHIWEVGNTSSSFHLKLCGSGGGGFLLGFAKDYALAKKELNRNKIDPITVYKRSTSRILNNELV